MKRKAFFNFVGLMVCALSLIFMPIDGIAADITLKLGHVAPPKTIYEVAANKLAERVTANTGGRVEIKVFGHSQFGNTPEHFAQLKTGAIDIFMSEVIVNFIVEPKPKNFFIMFSPYLFETYEHLHKFLASDLFRSMMAKVEKAGNIKYIGYLGDRPPRNLVTNDTKILTPSDLKGLKLRVPVIPSLVAVWKAWGASPTPLAAKEIYNALKTGLVDGQTQPALAVRDAGYYEIQKYFIHLDYVYSGLCAWMNQQKWNSLVNEIKGSIEKSVAETEAYISEYAADQDLKAERFIQEKGMVILRPDLEPFKAIALEANLKNDGQLWEKGLYDKIKALK